MSAKTRCSMPDRLSNSGIRFLDGGIFAACKFMILVGPARFERATNWLKAEGYIPHKPLSARAYFGNVSIAVCPVWGALVSNCRGTCKAPVRRPYFPADSTEVRT